jgi:hypothetical protein
MKSAPLPTSRAGAPDSQGTRTGRRQLVVGAGVAAGAALVAVALKQRVEGPPAVAGAKSGPASADGYRLTDHILRYYETTRT